MKPTDIVITTLVILAGLWELFAIFTGKAKTFSRAFQAIGLRSPAIAFVVGYLCGHIFGYMQPEPVVEVNPVNQVEVQNVTD